MHHEDDQDEVSFWQEMIQQWETTREEPVPVRMREALAFAKRRLQSTDRSPLPWRKRLH